MCMYGADWQNIFKHIRDDGDVACFHLFLRKYFLIGGSAVRENLNFTIYKEEEEDSTRLPSMTKKNEILLMRKI